MTYNTIDNISNLDLESTLRYPTIATPIFWPAILFALFMVVTLSSFFREVRREGKGHLISSLAVAGFVTTSVATVMTFLSLIQRQVMVYTLVISMVFIILYILTARRGT